MKTCSLNGNWKLIAFDIEKNSSVRNDDEFEMHIPGELHQALIDAGRIENPYLGCNNNTIKWIDKSKWRLVKDIEINKVSSHVILRISRLRAKATIYINGTEIGYAGNEYKVHYFNISDSVVDGDNNLEIEIEGQEWNKKDYINAIGIFGSVSLIETDDFLVRDYSIIPIKASKSWRVEISLEIESFGDFEAKVDTELLGTKREDRLRLKHGIGSYKSSFTIDEDSVELWWPNGYGKQHMYPILLKIGNLNIERFIAFRTSEMKKSKNLAILINGKPIFMKGANWQGVKALPNGSFTQMDIKLLEAMTSANMNMIRVPKEIGYEREAFYCECDRLGIAVWQCLPDRKEEEEYTLLEIKSHPSIVLWSAEGHDAEWFERRERELDPTRPFYIEKDDNHSWPNWLGGENFSAYHKKSPDFISQFGFPSFPGKRTLSIISNRESLTSREIESHLQDKRNIEEIYTLLARNVSMPEDNEKIRYLSEVQQASAITEGVMGWRSLMPYTMGTLISTLNDSYPAISNSMIDFSGEYKLTQYAAKRFFSNLTPLLYIENDKLLAYVANDTFSEEEVEVKVKFRYFNGKKKESHVYNVKVPPMTSVKVKEIDLRKIDRRSLFAYAKMQTKSTIRERTVLLDKPKNLELENPEIKVDITKLSARKASIKLSSTKPAFHVALYTKTVEGTFSDNLIAIRQTAEKNIIFNAAKDIDIDRLKNDLVVMDLYSAMH